MSPSVPPCVAPSSEPTPTPCVVGTCGELITELLHLGGGKTIGNIKDGTADYYCPVPDSAVCFAKGPDGSYNQLLTPPFMAGETIVCSPDGGTTLVTVTIEDVVQQDLYNDSTADDLSKVSLKVNDEYVISAGFARMGDYMYYHYWDHDGLHGASVNATLSIAANTPGYEGGIMDVALCVEDMSLSCELREPIVYSAFEGEWPSYSPSTPPSDKPSEAPSTSPSMRPSFVPSAYPSMRPSTTPSISPQGRPSSSPSLSPSSSPSSGPTEGCPYEATLVGSNTEWTNGGGNGDGSRENYEYIDIVKYNTDTVVFDVKQFMKNSSISALATLYEDGTNDGEITCDTNTEVGAGHVDRYTAQCTNGMAQIVLYAYDVALDEKLNTNVPAICKGPSAADLSFPTSKRVQEHTYILYCTLPWYCPPKYIQKDCQDFTDEPVVANDSMESPEQVGSYLHAVEGELGPDGNKVAQITAMDVSPEYLYKTFPLPINTNFATIRFTLYEPIDNQPPYVTIHTGNDFEWKVHWGTYEVTDENGVELSVQSHPNSGGDYIIRDFTIKLKNGDHFTDDIVRLGIHISSGTVGLDDVSVEMVCIAPSLSPSIPPTGEPSASPQARPSLVPSSNPSKTPSSSPSKPPSRAPSTIPNNSPSSSPSTSPSARPSSSPSDAPSMIPSTLPSSSPSASPSAVPTVQPSASPSDNLTDSSYTPSTSPSDQPSASPSSSPSAIPSASPSSTPRATPSESPSSAPSMRPSVSPSVMPSTTPSVQPSVSPSASPSLTPSSFPSCSPHQSPSEHCPYGAMMTFYPEEDSTSQYNYIDIVWQKNNWDVFDVYQFMKNSTSVCAIATYYDNVTNSSTDGSDNYVCSGHEDKGYGFIDRYEAACGDDGMARIGLFAYDVSFAKTFDATVPNQCDVIPTGSEQMKENTYEIPCALPHRCEDLYNDTDCEQYSEPLLEYDDMETPEQVEIYMNSVETQMGPDDNTVLVQNAGLDSPIFKTFHIPKNSQFVWFQFSLYEDGNDRPGDVTIYFDNELEFLISDGKHDDVKLEDEGVGLEIRTNTDRGDDYVIRDFIIVLTEGERFPSNLVTFGVRVTSWTIGLDNVSVTMVCGSSHPSASPSVGPSEQPSSSPTRSGSGTFGEPTPELVKWGPNTTIGNSDTEDYTCPVRTSSVCYPRGESGSCD